MQTEEFPRAHDMPKVLEKPFVGEAASKTPQANLSIADDQLDYKKNNPATGSSAEKDDVRPTGSASAAPEYPKAWKLFVIIAALCLAVFLVALDQTIVAVAVPKITDHFHSLDDVGW